MKMSTNKDFVSVSNFDQLLVDKIFEFCIIYNKFYNRYIISINKNKADKVIVYMEKGLCAKSEIIELNKIKVIELTFKIKNETFKITAIYRSPSTGPFVYSSVLDIYLREDKKYNYWRFQY